jgi:hypothetical protein
MFAMIFKCFCKYFRSMFQVFYLSFFCMLALHLNVFESASGSLVSFGELNDNIIKGLTSLLSVE